MKRNRNGIFTFKIESKSKTKKTQKRKIQHGKKINQLQVFTIGS